MKPLRIGWQSVEEPPQVNLCYVMSINPISLPHQPVPRTGAVGEQGDSVDRGWAPNALALDGVQDTLPQL